MEYIMKIGEIVMLPSVGYVISGNNPQLTKYDISILNLKDKLMVKTSTDEFMFKVLDVNVSFSITENLIIGIRVEESNNFPR
ncbi:hypothetical protein [Paenibacillus macerans]|uniref:hypothetical protein n=1 Tax=Paenibacillus macerans TaxID=44252 RepID=UPI002040C1E5|nr:hypothetical protein [Paenibacillus macerans]MCM3702073.1 hypothetical protein [Paenibacillus macerans]